MHATTAELHGSEQRMDACANGLLLERLDLPVAVLLRAILRTSGGFPGITFPFTGMLSYDFLVLRGCATW